MKCMDRGGQGYRAGQGLCIKRYSFFKKYMFNRIPLYYPVPLYYPCTFIVFILESYRPFTEYGGGVLMKKCSQMLLNAIISKKVQVFGALLPLSILSKRTSKAGSESQ